MFPLIYKINEQSTVFSFSLLLFLIYFLGLLWKITGGTSAIAPRKASYIFLHERSPTKMHAFVVWSAEPDFNQANYWSASWRATVGTCTSTGGLLLSITFTQEKNSFCFAKMLRLLLEIRARESSEKEQWHSGIWSNNSVAHSLTKMQIKLLISLEIKKSMKDDLLV